MSKTGLKLLGIVGVGALLASAPVRWASGEESKDIVTVQARLLETGAGPLNADLSVRFEIWDVASGGTAANKLWQETPAQPVPVRNGILSYRLGATTAFGNLFKGQVANDDRYVAIVLLSSGQEIVPRIRLTAVPYAQRSTAADVSSRIWDPGTGSFRTLNDLVGAAASTGLENSGGTIRIAAAAAGGGLIGGGGSVLAVNVGAGIQIASDAVAAKPADFLNGQSAAIDADKLRVDLGVTNYTPTTTGTNGAASDATDLAAHLRGIDNALASAAGGAVDPGVCGGRLSASSSEAVPTTDQTSSTIHYLPYVSSKVALWSGSAWVSKDIGAGLSSSLTSLTTTTTPNYDVFLYDNSGTVTFEFVKWSSDSARAAALSVQDGVLVKSGASTRRYLGTIRVIDDAGTIKITDTATKRFVWNFYNRVARFLTRHDPTDSWAYATAAWHQANASASNQVEFVIGISGDRVRATVNGMFLNASQIHAGVGIGLDSITIDSAQVHNGFGQSGIVRGCHAEYVGAPGIGHHYIAWLEYNQATGATTWYGDAGFGGGTLKSGLTAEVFA